MGYKLGQKFVYPHTTTQHGFPENLHYLILLNRLISVSCVRFGLYQLSYNIVRQVNNKHVHA